MPQLTITEVSDVKQGQYGLSCKIKCTDGQMYYINEDATPRIGKPFEANIQEKISANKRKYKIAYPVKELELELMGAPTPASNGKLTLNECREMAKFAHDLALELEPDEQDATLQSTLVDRSVARMALVNTLLIAFTSNNSKGISLAENKDDDNIPF